ncbi:MAG: glycoside hydrolase family 15 protein [Myxococcales bacterium]|nr:glycoside hydrolase family 15 protein [Myxococcales bacterium]
MDLYSASRRYTRPFTFTSDSDRAALPIAARGIIGDGHTAALVRVDGAIDWLCLPQFDSPSIFSGILDAERGGFTSITPACYPFESLQAYDPDTNVLETLHEIPGQGTVRVTDYMPWTDDPRATIHEVHRRVECRDGEVELDMVFDPRFDYGRTAPTFEIGEHGVLARSGDQRLVAATGGRVQWETREQGGVRARLRLKRDERRWMILSWNAPTPETIGTYRPFDQLRTTRAHWRDWARGLEYEGPFRHHVMRSALALKLMIYGPTGAMVAAPTTSLPEWLGGGRNWDYRYAWTRDTAMAIHAANRIGYRHEAREFFHFVRDALEESPQLEVMYTIDGARVPTEEELPHLSGYADSKPVRIGNGAKDQLQLDTAGALIDAAFMYEKSGGALGVRAWRQLRTVTDQVTRDWHKPDHGIWEPRSGVQHNVHSKLMSWVALDRGHTLAQRFHDHDHAERWAHAATAVRRDLLDNGLDPSGKHFVRNYGTDKVDGALLLLPIFELLDPTDARMQATIEAIRSQLGTGPFLHRYRAEDGVGGPEGAFILCGFWLAEALADAGRVEEAQEVFVAHAEASNHLGLLSEEIDPDRGTLLGNFPQAFSHLGLINAAIGIDKALRMRDEGTDPVSGRR